MIVSRPLARVWALLGSRAAAPCVSNRAPRFLTWKTFGPAALLALSVSTTAAQVPSVQLPGSPDLAPTAAPSPATPPPAAAPVTPAAGAPDERSWTTTKDAVRAALSHWGCVPSDLLAYEQRWYAACGAAGVFVVDRREDDVLVLSERRAVAGRAHALFVRGEAVWVESTRIEAHPIGEFTPSTGTGAASGVASVPRTLAVDLPAHQGRAYGVAERGQATYSKLAPPRVGRLLRVEGGIRPYLPMRSLGVAMLADAAVTYHGERAWYVQAQFFPLGGTATKGQDASVFGFATSVGYDHPYFGVGVGIGTLRRGAFHSDFDPIQRRTRDWVEHSFGLSVTQALRVGALDGLSFTLLSAFVLDNERWQFGFFDLAVQIPLNRQTWLTAGGGGAEQAGYLYAEVALRRLIHGDLGSGSLFVKPSVGVAGIDNRIDGVGPGPMIGCHLEWRR